MESRRQPWVRPLTSCPLPSSAAEHRVLGRTQTHTRAAASALVLKNETNISPSTIQKVCVFHLLPSANLGLNLRGYVFLFKQEVCSFSSWNLFTSFALVLSVCTVLDVPIQRARHGC